MPRQWRLVQSYSIASTKEQFWKAIEILVNRSHIINRRLTGEEVIGKVDLANDKDLEEITSLIFSPQHNTNIEEIVKNYNNHYDCFNEHQIKTAVIKRLIPKCKCDNPIFGIILLDYSENVATFINGLQETNIAPSFTYGFSYTEDSKLNVWVEEGVEDSNKSLSWIITKVVPKVVKWMEHEEEGKTPTIRSLSLVGVTEYSTMYSRLKETYGKQLVQMWPENTDPLKYVYEDIGIAAYLLLLWTNRPKQRFVDLGCGNGLLVHILNSEGHLGTGYDMKARRIWSMYPSTTKLEIQTIIPSSETIFPEVDWLIGNHSDELTVWIPVMAARSSYSCNFFLLPCCPYNFDGKKYCRSDSSLSQYNDFLNYVEKVCDECGIVPEKDKLRIPSTKRICFVGRTRQYSEDNYKENIDKLQVFVSSKCKMQFTHDTEEVWCSQFTPRSEERVRNCTKVQADVRERIVSLVADQLLAKRRLSSEGWNYGGSLEISSIAKIVPAESLQKLKKECGGLQTLLKNHHHIFKVSNGKVEFRIPIERGKAECIVWKKKPCWFYENHPNKCPLVDEHCSFIHGR